MTDEGETDIHSTKLELQIIQMPAGALRRISFTSPMARVFVIETERAPETKHSVQEEDRPELLGVIVEILKICLENTSLKCCKVFLVVETATLQHHKHSSRKVILVIVVPATDSTYNIFYMQEF